MVSFFRFHASSASHPHAGIWMKYLWNLLSVLVVFAGWRFVFYSGSVPVSYRSVCKVESKVWYEMPLSDGDTLRFSVVDGRTSDCEGNPDFMDSVCTTGAFISPRGHLVTSAKSLCGSPDTLRDESLFTLLEKEKGRMEVLAGRYGKIGEELDGYARRHSVVDDGYNEVMAYRDYRTHCAESTDSLCRLLRKALDSPRAEAYLCSEILVTHAYRTKDGTSYRYSTQAAYKACGNGRLLLLRTDKGALPPGASFFSQYAEPDATRDIAFLACFGGEDFPSSARPSELSYMGDRMGEGGVWTDGKGRLSGIRFGTSCIPAREIKSLYRMSETDFQWWGSNLLTAVWHTILPPSGQSARKILPESRMEKRPYSRHHVSWEYVFSRVQAGDYFGHTADGLPEGYGRMIYADSTEYSGAWHRGLRQGCGTFLNAQGLSRAGLWKADTLSQGVETGRDERYEGEFDARGLRHGYGKVISQGGDIYLGNWVDGKRDGFGFSVGTARVVHAGIWRDDVFKGERMIYTSDRVYGIDIARYQHESGRKKYGIDWNSLRITNLDYQQPRRTNGRQDYPVSFVYVKASQGTTIVNRYYGNDISSARKHGIPVGAYHFFSTQCSGLLQAMHFLNTAAPKVGDMAPVLDVEPTDGQIKAMGGKGRLVHEMLVWLRTVKGKCGTSPVIYVSQSFVNKYLADGPEELKEYPVWIARYGEYKPYVKLSYWQLSPRGKVRGIVGDVDINVYNGTREDFTDYLATTRVKQAYIPPRRPVVKKRTGTTSRKNRTRGRKR